MIFCDGHDNYYKKKDRFFVMTFIFNKKKVFCDEIWLPLMTNFTLMTNFIIIIIEYL